MTTRAALIAAAALWVPLCAGAGTAPPTGERPTALGTQPRQSEDAGPKAAVCPICTKPFHLHVDANFRCIPQLAENKTILAVKLRRAKCPVCGLEFKAPKQSGWQRRATYDRDFCAHAPGSAVVFCSSWLCVRCGYAAPAIDFDKEVDDEIKRFVREKLSGPTFDFLKTRTGMGNSSAIKWTPDDMVKIVELEHVPELMILSNVIEIEKFKRSPPSKMAKLYVEASHACRRAVCSPLFVRIANLTGAINEIDVICTTDQGPAVEGGDIAALILREIDRRSRAVAKGDNDEEPGVKLKYCMFLTLAGAYDRIGDQRGTRIALDQARKALSEKPSDRRGRAARAELLEVIDARKSMLERENIYQVAAVSEMRKALAAGEYPEPIVLQVAYLMGEISRRAGDYGGAKVWLGAARALAPRGSRLAQWIDESARSPLVKAATPQAGDMELVGRILKATRRVEIVERPVETGAGHPEAAPAVETVDLPVPKSCAEAMRRIHGVLASFRKARGSYPDKLDELVAGGFITAKACGAMMCVKTRTRLFYRKPEEGKLGFVLYHNKPMECECKNLLWSTGEVLPVGTRPESR